MNYYKKETLRTQRLRVKATFVFWKALRIKQENIVIKKHVLVTFILIFCYALNSSSQPSQNLSGFCGTIQINGTNAPTGTIVKPTINGIEYPQTFTVETSGIYGLLFVNADDLSTPEKEGGVNGEAVCFIAQVGEKVYGFIQTGTWTSDTNQQIDLSSSGEIPVELSSFRAESKNNSVNLFWTTVSESNNFGFEIQRSRNDNFFNKIAFRHGHGTTNSPQTYN